MKTKFIIIGIMVFIIVSIIITSTQIFGWMDFRSMNYTSKEHKSNTFISKKEYSKDSLELARIIRTLISEHLEPYDNAIRLDGELEFINDNSTKIYIDSIFYSPKKDKVAYLVIVENSNKKLYTGKSKEEIESIVQENNLQYNGNHFDGNSFVAEREASSFSTYFYGDSFTNSRTYKENSEALRNVCLNCNNKINEIIYNFDDNRFWNSAVWKNKKADELKKKEFEEEKKKNPKNIYEPK